MLDVMDCSVNREMGNRSTLFDHDIAWASIYLC
jgi:hypothetical protein